MVEKANDLSKNDNVSKIYLNKGLSNEIPGIKPNRRPDIMVVRKEVKLISMRCQVKQIILKTLLKECKIIKTC